MDPWQIIAFVALVLTFVAHMFIFMGLLPMIEKQRHEITNLEERVRDRFDRVESSLRVKFAAVKFPEATLSQQMYASHGTFAGDIDTRSLLVTEENLFSFLKHDRAVLGALMRHFNFRYVEDSTIPVPGHVVVRDDMENA